MGGTPSSTVSYGAHDVIDRDDNSVSVIDGNNNTNIKDIPVGKYPSGIGVNTVTNTIKHEWKIDEEMMRFHRKFYEDRDREICL